MTRLTVRTGDSHLPYRDAPQGTYQMPVYLTQQSSMYEALLKFQAHRRSLFPF
jgi:hypothetical protein